MLGMRKRRLAWRVARQAWIEADGDVDKATSLAKAEFERMAFSPMIILALVSIAIELFKIWRDWKQKVPSIVMDEDLVEDAHSRVMASGVLNRAE